MQLKIVYERLDQIQHLPGNPKNHDQDAIIASIQKYGFLDPLGVSETSRNDFDGNGRLDALASMMRQGLPRPSGILEDSDGMWLVPTVGGVDWLSADDEMAAAIALNRTNERGGWSRELLASALGRLAEQGKSDGTGFNRDEINALLKEVGKGTEGAPDAVQVDRAEELRQQWHVEPGQLWKLGQHRLIRGDCTDPSVVDRVVGGEPVALVVTDPPYGVEYSEKNRFLNAIARGNRIQKPIENDHGDKADIQETWLLAFQQMHRVMRPGAVIYCFMPQGGDQMMMMMMMMMRAGIEPRHEIIWVKNNHVLGRVDYAYKHEPILYAWKAGGHKFYGDFQTSLLAFDKPQKSDLHPTMKPVPLIERLLLNSSQPGEIVLDPYCGSGTCLIASEKQGRQARVIEIAPEYAAVTIQRWVDLTSGTPERISADDLMDGRCPDGA